MRHAWARASRLGRTPGRGALTLTGALALSGCATTAPTLTPQARDHYDSSAQAPAHSGAALLADACSYRLELGTSHITQDNTPDTVVQPQPLGLTPEQGKALAELLGARYVWLLNTQEQDVSRGRAADMVALTSVLTFGLTGGTHSSGHAHEDGIVQATTLVNLEQPAVLWRSVRSTVARNLVDFQRPLGGASGFEQAAKWWFTPFYTASSNEPHPVTHPRQPIQKP